MYILPPDRENGLATAHIVKPCTAPTNCAVKTAKLYLQKRH